MKRLLLLLLVCGGVWLVVSEDARRTVLKYFDRHEEQKKAPVPMAVTKIADDRNLTLEEATAQFKTLLASSPRFRFEGGVTEQLPSGHVLVVGQVRSSASAPGQNQGYALFGFPSSATLAAGAVMRCDVNTVGVYNFARADGQIVKIQELIYAGEITAGPAPVTPRSGTLLDHATPAPARGTPFRASTLLDRVTPPLDPRNLSGASGQTPPITPRTLLDRATPRR